MTRFEVSYKNRSLLVTVIDDRTPQTRFYDGTTKESR